MKSLHTFLVGCSLFLLAGCEKQPATVAPVVPAAPAPVTADMVAKLVKADAADGKTDKVVEKCAGCALGMAGNAAKSVKAGEYTLHLCDHCYETGKADPMKCVAKLPN